MTVQIVTTVLTAAPDTSLVELDEIKAELKIDPDDTSNDDWLDRARGQVSKSISSFCNRSFMSERVQDVIYIQQDPYPYQIPGGVSALQLTRWPVKTLESVKQTTTLNTTNTLTAGTDFVLDSTNGQLLRLSPSGVAIRWEALPTTAIYTAGYDEVPDDVVVAALRWLVWRWSERQRDPTLKATQQPDYGTKSYWVGGPPMSGGVPQEIASLLDNYRVPLAL
jgi:hypothetical protein